jgi:hypothetical protein
MRGRIVVISGVQVSRSLEASLDVLERYLAF